MPLLLPLLPPPPLEQDICLEEGGKKDIFCFLFSVSYSLASRGRSGLMVGKGVKSMVGVYSRGPASSKMGSYLFYLIVHGQCHCNGGLHSWSDCT